MTYSKHIFLLLFIAPLIIFSCKKDNDNTPPGNPPNSGGGGEWSGEDFVSGFNVSGGLSGAFNGDDTQIIVIHSEEGTTIGFSTDGTDGQDQDWDIVIGVSDGDIQSLVPNTYSLGSIDDADVGSADFFVSFQFEPEGEDVTHIWGFLGPASGTLTITDVEYGVYDNGTKDRVTGTFSFTAEDSMTGTVDDADLLEPIVVTSGYFEAIMQVN